jgi:hypothetical protein
MSNVTPITPPKRKRSEPKPKPKVFVLRDASGENPAEPSTLHLIQALTGVCAASEELAVAQWRNVDPVDLTTAARILSQMLQDRMELPQP